MTAMLTLMMMRGTGSRRGRRWRRRNYEDMGEEQSDFLVMTMCMVIVLVTVTMVTTVMVALMMTDVHIFVIALVFATIASPKTYDPEVPATPEVHPSA